VICTIVVRGFDGPGLQTSDLYSTVIPAPSASGNRKPDLTNARTPSLLLFSEYSDCEVCYFKMIERTVEKDLITD
jgi:hypothetical protein